MSKEIESIEIDKKTDIKQLIGEEAVDLIYVKNVYDSLNDIGCTIDTMSKCTNPDKMGKNKISNICLNIKYDDSFLRYFIEPNNSSNTIFFEYDVIDDMILESSHPILGGEPDENEEEDIGSYLKETREDITMEQMHYICQSSRGIDITNYENNIYGIASSCKIPIEYELFTIGREITGVNVEHKIFRDDHTLQSLYNKITKLSNIKNTYVRNIFNAYLDNGLTIPENINSDIKEPKSTYNKRSVGFQ